MQVYWLEQVERDVPPENEWLSTAETIRLKGIQFPKRSADWRLGRWTAKHAVASYLNLPVCYQSLAEIEIRPAPCGAPEIFLSNTRAAINISLSHRAQTAMCAVTRCGGRLGCDLEVVEPHSEAFAADYFTPEETAAIARMPTAERYHRLALLWSAKESVLKALRTGLRLDTRTLVVNLTEARCCLNGWKTLRVQCSDGQVFHGWWQAADNRLRTLVADPPPHPPILLSVEHRPSAICWCSLASFGG
jgi:4'-phosphopantetheinyl transferase